MFSEFHLRSGISGCFRELQEVQKGIHYSSMEHRLCLIESLQGISVDFRDFQRVSLGFWESQRDSEKFDIRCLIGVFFETFSVFR